MSIEIINQLLTEVSLFMGTHYSHTIGMVGAFVTVMVAATGAVIAYLNFKQEPGVLKRMSRYAQISKDLSGEPGREHAQEYITRLVNRELALHASKVAPTHYKVTNPYSVLDGLIASVVYVHMIWSIWGAVAKSDSMVEWVLTMVLIVGGLIAVICIFRRNSIYLSYAGDGRWHLQHLFTVAKDRSLAVTIYRDIVASYHEYQAETAKASRDYPVR